MFPGRCQYGDRYGQCALADGHAGPHKSESLLKREAYEESNPSLSAIRRVVREEIRAALAGLAASEPQTGSNDE
jgi:hypothetical protein